MKKINWPELLNWDEDMIKTLRTTGFYYYRQGKYKLASVYYEALVLFNSSSLYDIRLLGASYLMMGDSIKALKHFDQALVLDPTDAMTQLNRVKAYLSLGQVREALPALKILRTSNNPTIANDASALLLAYR
ncbi:MAG: tetratricopeptide repeat protein [Parachlamydiales bacterium]|nr:tetratricopeptide repeat protein [Parachlamydiales bacterium]